MGEDRIKSEFNVSYKATNSAGLVALEISTTIKVADQSPESASAHLAAAVAGLMAPAAKQAGV